MAVIAVYSVKGGVGKTTLAANLAWCSAQISRRKTVLWDLDPASGAAFLLGVDGTRKSADRAFADDADFAKLIQPTAYANLAVLAGDESLRDLDQRLAKLGKRKRLAKLTRDLGRDHERVILDCPPVMNEISAQIMRAVDLLVVPLPPSPLSARALEQVRHEVANAGKTPPVILPVLSMLDLRRILHREVKAANPNWPVIPFASALEQCAVQRAPVAAFQPGSAAAKAIARLWTAIERQLAQAKVAGA